MLPAEIFAPTAWAAMIIRRTQRKKPFCCKNVLRITARPETHEEEFWAFCKNMRSTQKKYDHVACCVKQDLDICILVSRKFYFAEFSCFTGAAPRESFLSGALTASICAVAEAAGSRNTIRSFSFSESNGDF